MFAKLSALALCFSFVSALDISLPLVVHAGAAVELDLVVVAGDPVDIGLLLIGDGVEIGLAANVAVAATLEVDIPANTPLGYDFVIAAVAVGDQSVVYADSNIFAIVY